MFLLAQMVDLRNEKESLPNHGSDSFSCYVCYPIIANAVG